MTEQLIQSPPTSSADNPSFDHTYQGSPPSTPRWVKVFVIGAVVLGLLFAGMHLSGQSPMAPLHMSPSGGAAHHVQAP
jgi:hypothetical protein